MLIISYNTLFELSFSALDDVTVLTMLHFYVDKPLRMSYSSCFG